MTTTINNLFEAFSTNNYNCEVHSQPTMTVTILCGEETRDYHGYIRMHHY